MKWRYKWEKNEGTGFTNESMYTSIKGTCNFSVCISRNLRWLNKQVQKSTKEWYTTGFTSLRFSSVIKMLALSLLFTYLTLSKQLWHQIYDIYIYIYILYILYIWYIYIWYIWYIWYIYIYITYIYIYNIYIIYVYWKWAINPFYLSLNACHTLKAIFHYGSVFLEFLCVTRCTLKLKHI